jgi:hypothetical protein
MLFTEILFAIIGAVLIGVLFYYIFKVSGPWGSFWSFLLILVLAGLAAAAWIPPIGPVFYDFAWLPTLFVILMFALLIAAATPSSRELETEPTPTEERAAIALGGFFWFFLILLAIAAIAGLAT